MIKHENPKPFLVTILFSAIIQKLMQKFLLAFCQGNQNDANFRVWATKIRQPWSTQDICKCV